MHLTNPHNNIAGLILLGTLLLAGCSARSVDDGLAAGDRAPAFTLPDQNGVNHSLADYRGQRVLIYFYPKDFTSGCTTEACGLRDAFDDYRDAGIVVLGISSDSQESHKAFEQEHGLPFTLLSDIGLKVAALYGAEGMLNYARRYSYLIDQGGRLLAIMHNVDPSTHSADVLALFTGTAQ